MSKLEGADNLAAAIRVAFADVPEPAGPRFRDGMLRFEAELARVFGPGHDDAGRMAALSEYPDLVFSMQPGTLAWFMPRMLQACLDDPDRWFDLYTKLDFLFQKEQEREPGDERRIREIDGAFTPGQQAVLAGFFAANRASNPNLHPDDAEPLRF